MSDTQTGALFGTGQDAPETATPHRPVSTTALLGIASLIALALVAGAQWGASTTPELSDIERPAVEVPAAEVNDSADQTVFDGRGKWGGYAR